MRSHGWSSSPAPSHRGFLGGLFLAVFVVASAASGAVQPGDPAPDFTLVDTQGTTWKLSDLRGRVVLLDLIGYGCPPCIAAAPGVEAIWQDYAASGGLQVVALEMWNGTLGNAESFIQQTGVTYPVLRNAGFLQSSAHYGIQYDNYVVIDGDGIVRYTSIKEPFSSFNDAALRATIDAYLPTAIEEETWSTVKELYR